jgi:hypothetical protein
MAVHLQECRMQARAKSAPKIRKIDIRVPVLQDCGVGGDTPLFDSVDRSLLQAIDGQATVHDLAVATGRTDEETAQSLAKLESLRRIRFVEAAKRATSGPPKRLESGVRPAMKTMPGDLTEHLELDEHEKPTVAPPPSDGEMEVVATQESDELVMEVVATQEVDDLLAALEDADEEPEPRFTLPGIGTRG